MKYLFIFIVVAIAQGCSNGRALWKKDKEAFEKAKVIRHYKSVSDMNDMKFEIRENNFFYCYRQLFDSVKNSEFPGRYTMNGDTMMLKYYNPRGKDVLGNKAMMVNKGKELIFFDSTPGSSKKWILF